MKKVCKTLMVLFIMVCVFSTSVFASKTEQELQGEKDKAEAQLKAFEKELTSVLNQMHIIEAQLIDKGEAIINATEQLKEAEENEKTQYANMMKRIVAMYENGNDNVLSMIFEAKSLAELFQRIENVQALHSYDRNELKKYMANKDKIKTLKATLEKDQKKLEDLQTQLAAQETALYNKIAAKEKEIGDLTDAIAEAARKAAEEAAKKEQQASGGGTGDVTVGQKIVEITRTWIGVWYKWGGNDRNGVDCSGLTKAVHAAVGIKIGRHTSHQEAGGKKVNSLAEALPGDIICYPGHVGIYIGNYRIIHAPRTGKQVQEASVYLGGTKPITSIRRYW